MRRFLLSAVVVALAVPASAQAPDLGKVQALATLKGRCEQFVMAGRDLRRNCNGAVLNTSYTNGRTSFMFTMADGSIVSFYGRDTPAAGGKATVRLEKVTIKDGTTRAKPATADATGTCEYTDPFAGPARVLCSARAMDRAFIARFTSDGSPPVVTRP